ncbi:MAG TPA: tetratricopeptide repeat protein [Blastocatellia bacterium]|jgi:tetratricopeptide (TPR) repeat protein|nr:tetratricopeptide repeat protein [Blastocatellia bacterium]
MGIKYKVGTGLIVGFGLLAIIVLGGRGESDRSAKTPVAREESPPESSQTLGDRLVRKAEQEIARAPERADGFNRLCAAFMQRARETGDFGYTSRAEAALKRSLEIEPENLDAIKLRAALLLSRHKFHEALVAARALREARPSDHTVYGMLTDALVELGRYDEASAAAEKMVLMRPDTTSYSRYSYLASLHGDSRTAIDMMRRAVNAASPQDPESLSWCRVHLGDELVNAGRLSEGEREYDLALEVFPEYHLALAAKARARIAAGEPESAVEFYKRARERVPQPDTIIALGNLYAKLGRDEGARREYDLVEFIEQSGEKGASTYSRQLALFWANQDRRLDEALAIAERERNIRSDIYSSDALAWCLYKKGRPAEARRQIDEAMRLGTRDAQIYYHAGMIYDALGDRGRAAKFLRLALQINPDFDLIQSDIARRALDRLQLLRAAG